MAKTTSTRTKRPMTAKQLANLSKGNPKVAERHARGEYDQRLVDEDSLTADPTIAAPGPRHSGLEDLVDRQAQMLRDYEEGIQERDAKIDRLEGRLHELQGNDADVEHDVDQGDDDAPYGYCPACDQPLERPMDEQEQGDGAPCGEDDDPAPRRRGPLGELWAGFTGASDYDDHPWDAPL